MQDQPKPDATVQVKAHFIPKSGGATLRFTTTNGDYLGSIEYDVATPQMLAPIANIFQNWAAQQTGGIVMSNGAAIPGLRS